MKNIIPNILHICLKGEFLSPIFLGNSFQPIRLLSQTQNITKLAITILTNIKPILTPVYLITYNISLSVLTLISTHQGELNLLKEIQTYTPIPLFNVRYFLDSFIPKGIHHLIKDVG